MKILVVEDDEFKLRSVRRLLEEEFRSSETYFARSISSAMRELEQNINVNAVILDMSLPTFDVGPGESGGRPQGFGGLSVIQHLDAMDIGAAVIVLTQFLQFGDREDSMGTSELIKLLKDDYPDHFRLLIHYGAGSDQWKADLIRALRAVSEAS